MYSTNTPYSEYLQEEQIKYPQLKSEDIEKLKDSLANNESLPPISDKKYLAFLHSCNFDIELAKRTIQNCYKYHVNVPQVFSELDPSAEDIAVAHRCLSIGQMPTSNLDKNERVLYIQFKENNQECFNYAALFKYLTMWMEYMLLMYGTCDGFVTVVDTKGLGWRHIVKLPLSLATKMLKFLELGLPVRVKAIHVLNTGMYTQMLLKLVMKFADQDLINKIKVHSAGSEDLFNDVPKKILPIEVGGLGKSHYHYSDKLLNDMKDIRGFFLEHNDIIINHTNFLNQKHDINDE